MLSCPDTAEILLVEDNPFDAELTLRALKKHNQNKVTWVKDGGRGTGFYLCQRSLFPQGYYLQSKTHIIRPGPAESVWS